MNHLLHSSSNFTKNPEAMEILVFSVYTRPPTRGSLYLGY